MAFQSGGNPDLNQNEAFKQAFSQSLGTAPTPGGTLNNIPGFQSDAAAALTPNPPDAYKTPTTPSPHSFEEVRSHLENASSNTVMGADKLPDKDKYSLVSRYLQPQAKISGLTGPTLNALYNTVVLAQKDGLTPSIGAGTNGQHAAGSSHYHGEGVDMSFLDSKGNYLPDHDMVETGKKYGALAGWGQMRDEWSQGLPGNTFNNAHLHFNWSQGAGGKLDPAVTTFRDRKAGDNSPFSTDTAAITAQQAAGQPQAKSIPLMAEQTAKAVGVPPDTFVRLIQAESNFNPNAVSSQGARGLGQLMPGTAADIAREQGVDPKALDNNPALQLRASAEYYKKMLGIFQGNEARAVGAYNMGPGNMQGVIDGKISIFPETSQYVNKILGPIDPTVTIGDHNSSDQNIIKGTGKVWAPGAEQQAARDAVLAASGHAQSLFQRLTGAASLSEFGGNFAASYNDPSNPSSPLYKSGTLSLGALPVSSKGDAQDYVLGTLNQFGDFAQDILDGFTAGIVPRSERTKKEGELAQGSYLGQAADLAGQGIGATALFEGAMLKLIGRAGGAFGGLNAARGGLTQTAGLLTSGLEGTAAVSQYRGMATLGGLAFADGTTHSLMDWMRGEGPIAGKPASEAVAHSLTNGIISGLSLMAGMGALTLVQGALPSVIRGFAPGVEGIWDKMGAGSRSVTQGLATGIGVGSFSGVAAAEISNLTGVSQTLYGQDISVPEAAIGGGVGGLMMSGFSHYMPNKLAPGGSKFSEMMRQKAISIFGADPNLVQHNIDSATAAMAVKSNSEFLAAGMQVNDTLQAHVAKLQSQLDFGQRAIDFQQSQLKRPTDELEARTKFKSQMESQLPVDTKIYTQGVMDYGQTVAETERATQALSQIDPSQDPKGYDKLVSARDSLANKGLKQRQYLDSVVEAAPHLRAYGDAIERIGELTPQVTQGKAAFDAANAKWQDQKLGMDHIISLASTSAETVKAALSDWQALNPEEAQWGQDPGAVRSFVENRLKDQIASPIDQDPIWNRHLGNNELAHLMDPEVVRQRAIQYQNYKENFVQDVVLGIQSQKDFPNALLVKINQAVKALDPSRESGLGVGIGPVISTRAADITKAGVYLDTIMGGRDFGAYDLAKYDERSPGKGQAATYNKLQEGKFRTEGPQLPTKVDSEGNLVVDPKAAKTADLDFYKGVGGMKTETIMAIQNLAEASGTTPPVNTEPFFKKLGIDGTVAIPEVNSKAGLTDLLAYAKAASEAGQDWVPFRGNKDEATQMVREYAEKIKPTEETLAGMRDTLLQYKESMKELPVAQRPGKDKVLPPGVQGPAEQGKSLDLSRTFNFEYATNNIHESFHQMGDFDRIGEALQSKDKNEIGKVFQTSKDMLEANLADLCLTDQERIGFGAYKAGDNSQAQVLQSNYQNRELGLSQDSGVTRVNKLDESLNLMSSKAGVNALILDAAQNRQVDETMASIVRGPMEGRSPGDIRGLASNVYANTVYAKAQGFHFIIEKVMGPFEQLIRETSGEIQGGSTKEEWKKLQGRGITPETFKRELCAVLEDSKKYPEFAAKYRSRGKTALYYSNEVKTMFEVMTSSNPEMGNYMRTQYLAATFPKYTDWWLKTQGAKSGGGLKTGYGAENIRGFGSREEFQTKIKGQLNQIKALGYDPTKFMVMDLNKRIDLLNFPEAGGRNAAEVERTDPDRYTQLVRKTEEISHAHLFDQTDDDPVSIFRRQASSILRAQGTRQLMKTLSDTPVDTGGIKGEPNMKTLLYIRKEGEDMPVMTYRDGSSKPYVQLDSILGMDAFQTKIEGKAVPAERIAIHPEVYDFLAHTALQNPESFGTGAFGRAFKRVLGIVKGYSLVGGFVPHFRNNQAMRWSEHAFAPMRAFAADEAGRHMIDSPNRDLQLATFNAIRSGVNMRTIQEASRGILQSQIDQMGPEVANRYFSIEPSKAGKFLQSMNPNDPINRAAYNQLGGMGKFFSDVLGAPLIIDQIAMREGAHNSIQAGMIGGFYHTREVLAQQHAGYLSSQSPEVRNRMLDQMAAQLTNHKASALPFFMQSNAAREAFGSTFMSPNWLLAKVHGWIDTCDSLLGLGSQRKGPLTPDTIEVSKIAEKLGIGNRKYAGYTPEIKQAIRNRMALTMAGGLFTSFIGLQVAQHMINGTSTLTHAPDKFNALQVGDRFMSGIVAGHIKDFLDFFSGAMKEGPDKSWHFAPAPAMEKIGSILERSLIPTDRALAELAENKDATGKPIYGDYRDEPVAAAAYARDISGYLAKSFVNFDDTLGYKSNTQLGDIMRNSLGGPDGVAPNSMNGKEYVLRALGMYDSRDNWAGAQSADLQHRYSFYKQDLQRRIQPFLDAAKLEAVPEEQGKYFAAGWAQANAGLPILDKELAAYTPDGRYRMTAKEYADSILRTMNPDLWLLQHIPKNAAGFAAASRESDHLQSGAQQP